MPKGRVLLAKIGLDGHDRGIKLIARILMEVGFEVIYTGLRQNPEAVVKAALQEDADLIGISILSGSHKWLLPRTIELLRKNNIGNVPVVVGGVVPDQDVELLKAAGVRAVFTPGVPVNEIIQTIEFLVSRYRNEERFIK